MENINLLKPMNITTERIKILLATISLMGLNSFLHLGQHPAAVMAKTTDEQIANQVCEKTVKGVVTVKIGNGHGSGFIVNKQGIIITNSHVVNSKANSVVTVVFNDGQTAPADVIGFAKDGVDFAILQVYNQPNLKPLPLAPVDKAKVGDRVFAIGTPLNTENQNLCTLGKISKVDQTTGKITHTAPINQGNSGGPLVNTKGEVIGGIPYRFTMKKVILLVKHHQQKLFMLNLLN
jgi:serine protease Do